MANFFSKIFKQTGAGQLLGGGPKSKRVKTLSPGQQEIFDLIRQGVGGEGQFGGLFGGFDPNQIAQFFEQGVAAPTRQRFFEQSVPELEQRAIASGLTRSSGLQNKIQRGAVDLESQLASLLAQQQMGAREAALGRQMGGIQTLLGIPESQVVPGKPTPFQQAFSQASPFIGKALAGSLTGGMGFFR